jgi:integrase
VAHTAQLAGPGAEVKTAQELARHSDPRITLAVYAKARTERLADAAELVGRSVLAG